MALCAAASAAVAAPGRVESDLVALYDFEEAAGTVVHDRATAGPPLHLQIAAPQAIHWKDGALVVTSSASIASTGPATKVIEAVKRSGALTIEAWVKPESIEQKGPARIVTLSADTGRRNVTLGQDAGRYDVRLRAASTSENGIPSLASPDDALSAELTHVVVARDAAGQATLYINGAPSAEQEIAGSLKNWSDDFRLALANELTGDRAWRGELHLVAIYSRALSQDEVAQNRAAGARVAAVDFSALLPPAAERKVDFVKDVQPILREHCFECHAQGNEEGGLNLGIQSRALEGGDHGPPLIRGKSAASRLIHLVAGLEKDGLMPPEENDPLTKEQIGILRAWIDQGLAWPKDADVLDPRLERARTHWAFQPLRAVEPPDVKDAEWVRTPIDRFILAALEAKGLTPAAPVDAGRLIRRVSFDMAGLPPTPEELAAFEAACFPSLLPSFSPSGDEGEKERQRDREMQAYEALVDKLLASRHYGERWGRHWLDVARYADSDGFESDADRPQAYQYRDFAIRALNDDLPFDTFVRWQLAGDEIAPDDPRAVAATGFLTGAPSQFLEDKYLEEERFRNRYNELDDILSTAGTGMLGLTLGCARCHDHKYDAVSSREYYRLLSAFHSGDRKVVKLSNDGPEALTFRDSGSEPRPTWLFERGNFYDRDQPVQLGFLEVLSRDRSAADYWTEARHDSRRSDTTYQRAALAAWTTDLERGAGALAARVIVNRVWQHHFGEGLVRTVSDFGVRSEAPSHPELLEWLAHDFVENGWRLKRLHRMILSSAAYQQAATFDQEKAKLDEGNRLLWSRQPQRLEAEILRDAMLAAGGTLNLEPYGPAFKPPIPAEAMVARNTKSPYPTDVRDDASTRRRSVYMFHKRVVAYPLLQAFDRPDAQQACGRREQTTVAPQALALLNDEFVRARAVDFANRLVEQEGDDERLVERAFQIAVARAPTAAERSASLEFLKSQHDKRQARDAGKPAAEVRLAAVADYCQAIFSLNEFLYID